MFKGKGRYDSFTYTQSGFSLKSGKLWLSKIGDIKIKLHRALTGEIKRLNIKKTPTGKWFASFVVEVEPDELLPKTGSSAGIDVGIKSFATLSNGEHIDNPRFFVHEEKALAKAQRKLSKAGKGTPDRAKALKAVRSIHERIANKRNDFIQKVSLKLAKSYDLIVFEDLNIEGMVKNHCLAKHIADASWNKLITTTSYKAEWAGKRVELVNPFNTSQICSGCGQIVKKDLSKRVHRCSFCGLTLDRDHNAAINILRLAFQRIAGRVPALLAGIDYSLCIKMLDAPYFNRGSSHYSSARWLHRRSCWLLMAMTGAEDRWALPDQKSALEWCGERNAEGIRCILDVLGENAKTEVQAARSLEAYISCAKAVEDGGLDASISVKLTDLGALFDETVCQENVRTLARDAASRGVGFEIDMEGQPLVDFTVKTALDCAAKWPLTLALAANFDRTPEDLKALLQRGIRPRLVKGAYLGDVGGFEEVQGRLKGLVEIVLAAERSFSLATCDPVVIGWALQRVPKAGGLLEFSFLKGLSDVTKTELAGRGLSRSTCPSAHTGRRTRPGG